MNKSVLVAAGFLILVAAGAGLVRSWAGTRVGITADTSARTDSVHSLQATESCTDSGSDGHRMRLGPGTHARKGRVLSCRIGQDPHGVRITYAIEDVANVDLARRKVYPRARCKELRLRKDGTFEIEVTSADSVIVFMASRHWSFESSGTSRRISASPWTDLVLVPPKTIIGGLSKASWDRHHSGTPAPNWVLRLRFSRVDEVRERTITPDNVGRFRVEFGGVWQDIKLIVDDRTHGLGSIFVKDVQVRGTDQVDVGVVDLSYDVLEFANGKAVLGHE